MDAERVSVCKEVARVVRAIKAEYMHRIGAKPDTATPSGQGLVKSGEIATQQ